MALPELPPLSEVFQFKELPWFLKHYMNNSKPRIGLVMDRVIELVCNLSLINAAQIALEKGETEIKASYIRLGYQRAFDLPLL